ncbi:transcriptional regulator [Burkholderia gladioli]|uniref:transcriptional regulator n=1 Tax=Burkholderia gladioli TaxID=28095 RepID=UPI00163F8AF1|nr:YdaS family helix-turn-helix protein [Burkholderia gladioli]MBW5284460.1 helix-turn-helix domain-containing protein [Burkholderia gladioli]
MDIKTYLSEKRGRVSGLARAIGAFQSDVSAWKKGSRPVPVHFMAAIELASGKQVTRREMRPDDWHLIWPEIADGEAGPGPGCLAEGASNC